jgi:hypothetical protein
MDMQYFVLIVAKLVFGTSYYPEVGRSFLSQSDWNLQLDEIGVVHGVLHLFEHNTLFHLPDVFFLDHSHEFSELFVDKFWVELVVVSQGLVHDNIAALFRQC